MSWPFFFFEKNSLIPGFYLLKIKKRLCYAVLPDCKFSEQKIEGECYFNEHLYALSLQPGGVLRTSDEHTWNSRVERRNWWISKQKRGNIVPEGIVFVCVRFFDMILLGTGQIVLVCIN